MASSVSTEEDTSSSQTSQTRYNGNLETSDEVREYLSRINDSTFPEGYRFPYSVVRLSNGVTNKVYRLSLHTHTNSNIPPTAILKYTPPFNLDNPQRRFIIDDQDVDITWDFWPHEVFALQDLPEINSQFVKTPKFYWYDRQKRVIFMEDAGSRSVTLKNLLLREQLPNLTVFIKIGKELGAFLARLHIWGENTERKDLFESPDSRRIAHWRTFTRVDGYIRSLYWGWPNGKIEKLKEFCDNQEAVIMTTNDRVIMGDFWTGNIMVNLTNTGELESLYVVDWEMIRVGDPATEISQMLAEIWGAGQFGPNAHASIAAQDLASALCEKYKAHSGQDTNSMLKNIILAATTHALYWTPRSFGAGAQEDERVGFLVAWCKKKIEDIMWPALDDDPLFTHEWGFQEL